MTELLLITEDDKIKARFDSLSKRYKFGIEHVIHEDKLLELPEIVLNYKLVVLDAPTGLSPMQMAERVQMTKQLAQCNYLVLLIDKKMSEDHTAYVKKQGVNFIFLKSELYKFKLDFLIIQNIHYLYTAIKAADLLPDTNLGFVINHFIPHRAKYFPLSSPSFSALQLKRLSDRGELYIERQELVGYKNYLRQHSQNVQEQARACLLSLVASFNDLVFLLIEDTSFPNFEKGQALLLESQKLAAETLKELLHLGDPAAILPDRTVYDLSIDRSIIIAARAGLWAEQLAMPTADIMLAALFMDLGELYLPSSTIYKLEKGEKLFADEQREYEHHPVESVNMLLSKKLPLTDFVRDLIQQSHELANQKGFPKQITADRIWDGSQLIRLAQETDEQSMIIPGQVKGNYQEKQALFLQTEMTKGRYTTTFLEAVARHLLPKKKSA